MAQILKEEMRIRIIKAAKNELLLKGYKDASMRRIAENSNMTVGNLYRYYDGKDRLIQSIVSPALEKIEKCVAKVSDIKFHFSSSSLDIKDDHFELHTIFDALSNELVEIYFEYSDEMKILMMHSNLNEDLSNWFSLIIQKYIILKYIDNLNPDEQLILSRSLASSIFSGVRECLKDSHLSKKSLKELLRIYFRFYNFDSINI